MLDPPSPFTHAGSPLLPLREGASPRQAGPGPLAGGATPLPPAAPLLLARPRSPSLPPRRKYSQPSRPQSTPPAPRAPADVGKPSESARRGGVGEEGGRGEGGECAPPRPPQERRATRGRSPAAFPRRAPGDRASSSQREIMAYAARRAVLRGEAGGGDLESAHARPPPCFRERGALRQDGQAAGHQRGLLFRHGAPDLLLKF